MEELVIQLRDGRLSIQGEEIAVKKKRALELIELALERLKKGKPEEYLHEFLFKV